MTSCLTLLAAFAAAFAAAAAPPPDDIDVEAILGSLTLDQKIGQMMIMGYEGHSATEQAGMRIGQECIGGFFFQPISNFNFPDELAALVVELQTIALESAHHIPLFVCLDAEGGAAAPIHYMLGGTPTPGNMALGASGREEDAYAAYAALGTDMRACGANVNFAPAVDALKNAANPDVTIRAFGGNVKRNAVLARGAVRGLQDARVIPCPKHFPGLVYEEEDSHSTAPHVRCSEAELAEGDLAHFRAAIEAGADMIMTHHAFFEAWDTEFPVTLSPKIISGILRDKLGFRNLIVTDSMGMGGITKQFGRAESTVLAAAAGCDIILQVSRSLGEIRERVDAVKAAVQNGKIPESQINESVRRILRTKAKYNLFTSAKPDPAGVYELMARPENVEANKRAALNGIVIVRDDAKLLPLPASGKKICVICPPSVITRAGKGGAGESMPIGYTLGRYIRAIAPDAVEVRIDTVPTDAEIRYAKRKAEPADILVVASLLAMQSPAQSRFINDILAMGKPTVIVGLGDPSDLTQFMDAKTFVAANSPVPISCEAAANVLFGKAKPGGTLPMPIAGVYPVGYAMPPP